MNKVTQTYYVCLVTQLFPILCDLMDHSPPGSSICGNLQARILEWVAVPPPGDHPNAGIKLMPLTSPAAAGEFFFLFVLI